MLAYVALIASKEHTYLHTCTLSEASVLVVSRGLSKALTTRKCLMPRIAFVRAWCTERRPACRMCSEADTEVDGVIAALAKSDR